MTTKVYDWVAYHANQAPSRLACIDLFSGRQYTYAQMQERTARLANGLRQQYAISKGDRVAAIKPATSNRRLVMSRPLYLAPHPVCRISKHLRRDNQ